MHPNGIGDPAPPEDQGVVVVADDDPLRERIAIHFTDIVDVEPVLNAVAIWLRGTHRLGCAWKGSDRDGGGRHPRVLRVLHCQEQ